MSTFFLNIVLLLFTLYFYKKIRNGMHIMQLGHYYNEPYIQWLKDNRKKHYKLSEFILLITPIMFLFINQIKLAYIVEIFALLILIATTKKRQEKKKFVRTPRVKRQFLTFLLISIALFISGNIFK